jgi:aspartate ammonia-lyase
MNQTRIEHDLLGEREVPVERYYGIQTLRALENFNITGIPIAHYPQLIHSLAHIKKAAALVLSNRTAEPHDCDSAVSITLGPQQLLARLQTSFPAQIKSGVIHVRCCAASVQGAVCKIKPTTPHGRQTKAAHFNISGNMIR